MNLESIDSLNMAMVQMEPPNQTTAQPELVANTHERIILAFFHTSTLVAGYYLRQGTGQEGLWPQLSLHLM